MSQPSYLSEPHIQFLSRALDEMRSGLLRIPRFQRRPLVWGVDKRLELLRSIRDGIPVGSILIWRTGLKLASLEQLGPHRLGAPPDKAFAQQYVLDGLQRLSALYAALIPSGREGDAGDSYSAVDEDWQYETYFDLEQEDFVMRPYQERPEASQLPLTTFLDNVRYRKALRRLPDNSQAERWIEISDRVSSAFQEYKIAIVPVVGDDLNLATRTFQLVNSQGTPMSYAYMVHARTWSTSFNLLDQMDRVREDHLEPIGWEDVSDERILDACKASMGLNLYETEAEELSKSVRNDPAILDRTVAAMGRAARFLGERCGIGGPKALPYAHHLTLLTMAFHRNPAPSEEILNLLEAWVWLSAAGNTLTGISGYRMQQLINDVASLAEGRRRAWPGGGDFRRKPLPQRSDFRHVRTKCIALLLGQKGGEEAVKALGREGANALSPILPRTTGGLSAEQFNRMGNRIVCEPSRSVEVQRELRGYVGKPLPSELSERHVLSADAWACLPDDPKEFVSRRHRDLEAAEVAHLVAMAERFDILRDAL